MQVHCAVHYLVLYAVPTLHGALHAAEANAQHYALSAACFDTADCECD
jgi:hypothetical protein